MTTDQDRCVTTNPPETTVVNMEPLFERLLGQSFPDSVSAIEYCRALCAEFGFTVKQEASANRNIYVYCSREGLPDSQRNPKTSPIRKRPSKRCDCRWRVVLSENDHEMWEFRKSVNPNASEHNHPMMAPEEITKAWPSQVNDLIIDLARRHLQTHEIRETVKQRFPDITWNERRFYNRLTEERKRIRQRGVLERSQRLTLLSAHLCAVVAANEEWAERVHGEMSRLFENYCLLSRLSPETIAASVDLQADMIQTESPERGHRHGSVHHDSDTGHSLSDRRSSLSADMAADERSPAKKRKSISRLPEVHKGAQMVQVPGYTLYIRNQPTPSYSESSMIHAMMTGTGSDNHNRHAMLSSPPDPLQQHQHPQQQQQQQQQPQAYGSSNAALFPLASPTSSSSSTSSMPFRHPSYGRRFDHRNTGSSPLHQPNLVPSPRDPPFVTYSPHPAQNQGQYGFPPAALPAYPMSPSFPSYSMPSTPMGSADPLSLGFDNTAMATMGTQTPFPSNAHPPQNRGSHAMMHQQPESTHGHDYQRQPSAVSTATSSSSPALYEKYPVKQEQMDHRVMLLQQREHQQRQNYLMSMTGEEMQDTSVQDAVGAIGAGTGTDWIG